MDWPTTIFDDDTNGVDSSGGADGEREAKSTCEVSGDTDTVPAGSDKYDDKDGDISKDAECEFWRVLEPKWEMDGRTTWEREAVGDINMDTEAVTELNIGLYADALADADSTDETEWEEEGVWVGSEASVMGLTDEVRKNSADDDVESVGRGVEEKVKVSGGDV